MGVHPRVLEEIARVARQCLAEEITGFREELKSAQHTVKNLKSQLSRIREPDQKRDTSLKEQIAAGEARASELKEELLLRERERLDEKHLRKTMASFDSLWKAMTTEEQSRLVRQMVERVDRKSTRLNSSHIQKSRMPSSA